MKQPLLRKVTTCEVCDKETPKHYLLPKVTLLGNEEKWVCEGCYFASKFLQEASL